jgi:S1-C subfamily serine protease
VLLGVCGVLVVAVAVLAGALVGRSGGSAQAGDAPAATPSPTASGSPSVADIYQKIGPSVVVVETADGSLGSGVIAADDGTVLTADHVIADGGAITVVFSDGTRSTATVASADAKTDIATLTPATLPQTLIPATLGGGAQVGGPVVAIGNPLGLTFSVSSGVVSGLNRTATTANGRFSGLIQFDAAVNPGSSAARCSTRRAWSSGSSSRSLTRATTTRSPASASPCPSPARSAAVAGPAAAAGRRYDSHTRRRALAGRAPGSPRTLAEGA